MPRVRPSWSTSDSGGPVPELGGRYLRVVTLADKVTILNAFPDRGFKP
jgi:hypothetical protein